jgi:hypothetical protein
MAMVAVVVMMTIMTSKARDHDISKHNEMLLNLHRDNHTSPAPLRPLTHGVAPYPPGLHAERVLIHRHHLLVRQHRQRSIRHRPDPGRGREGGVQRVTSGKVAHQSCRATDDLVPHTSVYISHDQRHRAQASNPGGPLRSSGARTSCRSRR